MCKPSVSRFWCRKGPDGQEVPWLVEPGGFLRVLPKARCHWQHWQQSIMHRRSLVMCLQRWFHKKIQIGLSLGFAWTRTRLPGFLRRLEEGLHDGYLASCCSITCGGQAWGPSPGASGRSTALQRGAGRLLCLLWSPLGVPPSQWASPCHWNKASSHTEALPGVAAPLSAWVLLGKPCEEWFYFCNGWHCGFIYFSWLSESTQALQGHHICAYIFYFFK